MKEEMKRNEKGQFTKGIKTFGRPKGSKNKVTVAVKEKFQQLVDAYSLDQMKTDLMALKPVDRLRVMTDLLDFFIPKLNRTDHGMALGDETIIIQLPTPIGIQLPTSTIESEELPQSLPATSLNQTGEGKEE